MSRETIILNAKDCSLINDQNGHSNAIQYFISQSENLNIFRFENKVLTEETEIAYFNTRDALWYAGRMVGEANFNFKDVQYKIKFEPRFGQIQFFRMLEEIFNIRLINSKSKFEKQIDTQFLIKQLIAFMWLNMLAKANKHGLPRKNINRVHKGTTIKGRLNVRKSIRPYYTEKMIVSNFREKQFDQTVVKILHKAYKILTIEYGLAKVKQPSAAKNAIDQIKASILSDSYISEYEYKSLKLKPIYSSFKSVIDLSWDIIKNSEFGNRNSSEIGQSFFVDMAEIWEIYIRSIIKKKFMSSGWLIGSPKTQIYKNKDYSRSIIPDIVMQRGEDTLIFDAKYKRMNYQYYDYDRADFFQIHTYINYYQQSKNVLVGGLLYPFSLRFNESKINSNHSKTLFEENNGNTRFIVDGIDLSEVTEESIKQEEDKFLNRISSLITQ